MQRERENIYIIKRLAEEKRQRWSNGKKRGKENRRRARIIQ